MFVALHDSQQEMPRLDSHWAHFRAQNGLDGVVHHEFKASIAPKCFIQGSVEKRAVNLREDREQRVMLHAMVDIVDLLVEHADGRTMLEHIFKHAHGLRERANDKLRVLFRLIVITTILITIYSEINIRIYKIRAIDWNIFVIIMNILYYLQRNCPTRLTSLGVACQLER